MRSRTCRSICRLLPLDDARLHPAQVAVDEDDDAFQRRVAAHVQDVQRAIGAVWCVTHQVVIEEVARNFRTKISGALDFLDHVVMLD